MPTSFNTNNYKLGSGRLYVQLRGETGLLNLGHIESAPFEAQNETLDHFSGSRDGQRVKDRTEQTLRSYVVNPVVHEINPDTLKLFFQSGARANLTQTGGTDESEDFDVTTATLGFGYRLAKRLVSGVSVMVGTDEMEEADEEDEGDYMVDYRAGIITVLAGGNITNGDTITVTYDSETISGDANTQTFNVGTTVGLQKLSRVIWIAHNSDGTVFEYDHNKATIAPQGAFDPTNTDWTSMSFSIEILNNKSNVNPFGTFRLYAPAAV